MGLRQSVTHSDPQILGGTPVFIGTRLPAQALIDYLEAGHPLDESLADFPSVTREQTVVALEEAIWGKRLENFFLDDAQTRR